MSAMFNTAELDRIGDHV